MSKQQSNCNLQLVDGSSRGGIRVVKVDSVVVWVGAVVACGVVVLHIATLHALRVRRVAHAVGHGVAVATVWHSRVRSLTI